MFLLYFVGIWLLVWAIGSFVLEQLPKQTIDKIGNRVFWL